MFKIKEITIRKARRETIKTKDGSYSMNEADVSLTVEGEEGKLNELEVIDRVKQLVNITENNDPDWIDKKQPNETKN